MTNPSPSGKLFTPVAFDPNDLPASLNVDALGNLKVVALPSGAGDVDLYAWTGSAWTKVLCDANGNLNVNVGKSGSTWLPLLTDSAGNAYNIPKDYELYNISGIAQVGKSGSAANATTVVYTVPANTTFYLCNMWITVSNTSANPLSGTIQINAVGQGGVTNWALYADNVNVSGLSLPFYPPMILPATSTISLISSIATLTIVGTFLGYTK